MPEPQLTNIWQELLRRKVIRTGLSYSITAWLLMQVFDVVLPAFGAPDWVFRVLIAILIAGLPIALVLAWSFEITPEKTDTPAAKRIGINGYLVAVLSLAIAFLLFDRFYGLEQSSTESAPQGFTASDYKSIAVLPFKNLSANQEDLYFSDGVMEAILNELSLIRELKVISRTSVEGYRDTTKPVTQIGQELDVAHVLEGSVQRAGDKVRVTAQLIAAQDDRHLWSRNYDRALSDIFAIQSEIANAIASNLKLILTDSEQKMMENAPTSELRAYDAFLRGSHVSFQGYFTIRSVDDVRESLRYCQQAIEFDPEFSLAYACIARSYLELGISEFITLDEWLPQARANVEKAISLDPDTWQAYDVLARISFAMGDLAETARYTAKVLEINPNQPDYLANQGSILIRRNEIDAGVDLVLRALELMPGGAHGFDDEDLVSMLQFIASDDLVLRIIGTLECRPRQTVALLNTFAAYALSNREFEMHRHCIELILAENDSPNNRINAGAASIFTGDFERAREIYESVMVKEEKPGQSFLKYPYKHRYALTLIETGEVERGQALLSEYRETLEASLESGEYLTGNKGVFYDLATIYATLGEKDAAVAMLREARARSHTEGTFFDPTWLFGDTMLDPLRDFPPFIEIIDQLSNYGDIAPEIFDRKLAERQAEGRLLWLKAD